MTDPDKRPADPFGMGADAEGKVRVLTPEQHAKDVLERDAEEELEEELPEDFADLEDIE